jgi:hypothetical protein
VVRAHIAILFVLVAGTGALAPSAGAKESPHRYPLGVYVTSVNHIDAARRTAGVDMWVWSISQDGRSPLKTMEMINADRATRTLASKLPRKQGAWSQVKVSGTFRQLWNFSDFPFDRQTVSVVIEEGVLDASSFDYRVDARNSSYDPEIEIPGWQVTGFDVHQRVQAYDTTFGDPELAAGGHSDYSRVVAELQLKRAHPVMTFFTLTVAMYAAILLALVTFFLHPDTMSDLGARMGLLAAALFAAVLNMLQATSEIGEAEGLGLLDQLHVVAFVLIVVATALGIASRIRLERGAEPTAIRRFDHVSFGVCTVLVIVANIALVALAV